MALKPWVRLPTHWIEGLRLLEFRWERGKGAANTAALMLLLVIAHHADDQADGIASLSYDVMQSATGLARATISAGLDILVERQILERVADRKGKYRLIDIPAGPWGKLPARGLYSGSMVDAFRPFRLRSAHELEALKVYIAFISRRNNKTNRINLSYDGIEKYTGIHRGRINSALTTLATAGLIGIRMEEYEGHPIRCYVLTQIVSMA